jgi:polygalacturonase
MCVSGSSRGSGRKVSPEQAIQKAVAGAAFLIVPSLTATFAFADPPPPPLPDITGSTVVTVSMGANPATNAMNITNAFGSLPTAGGTVIIPTGTWNVNPFSLGASNADFELEGNLVAPTNASGNWGTTSQLINWSNSKNSELTGTGYIDGQGGVGSGDWWSQSSGIPNLVMFSNAHTFLIQGVTFYNSPKEFVKWGGSSTNDITVNDITISAPASSPNTVGLDPSGNNFLITGSNISTGDDDIALNSSTGNSANTNIAITNMTIGLGHGISIGSITTLGVNNLTVNNITFNGTVCGFRLKSNQSAGGTSSNLLYNSVTMTNVFYPVYISSWYNGGGNAYPSNANSSTNTNTLPVWQNITFNNITSSWTSTTATNYTSSIAGLLYGLPQSIIQNVTFNNVNLSAYQGMSLAFAGTSTAPISFTGNWSITTTTGQQFGTFTAPNSTNIGGDDTGGGVPGKLVYYNGSSTTGGTFTGWEASNIVNLSLSSVPEPSTVSLGLIGSAMALMRRRRRDKSA